MKIESDRTVHNRFPEMLRGLKEGPVIITRNGRPCAALVQLNKRTDLEAFLVAHNPRLTALMERVLAEGGGAPLEEVEREVSRREAAQRRRPRRKR